MKNVLVYIFFISLILVSCEQKADKPQQDDRKTTVEFKGRTLDLEPYFEGFPYVGFHPYYKAEKLFYFEEDTTRMLKFVDLNENIDLKDGTLASDIDFSKRNVWSIKYNPKDEKLYWSGDEKNDEVLNLYSLNPLTKEIEKLTDVPYIFGWGWNEEKSKIGYIARLGTKEKRQGELKIIDMEDMSETVITKDIPELRYTWGNVSFSPESKYVVIPAYKNAHRNFGNMMLIDIENKTQKLLTDSSQMRRGTNAFSKWLSNDEFLYTSNEDGYINIYKYNVKNDKKTQLTEFTRDVKDFDMIEMDGKKHLFAVLENPIQNEMFLVDPANGEVVFSQPTFLNYSLKDSKDNKIIATATSNRVKFRLDEIEIMPQGFNINTLLEIPEELEEKIMHANVERIEYPTFDKNSKTDSTRMIHAYLYKPENPLPKEEQMVLIQSFYGGGNYFHNRSQILTQAGLYVLSPSPRGSSGFGKDFYALNDKDLGGNEIIDVIYAAKYISEKLDIPPERIGVFGGSHGGYATMRLLSFPGEINGNKADFDFGFGMSHAGFSDIIHFYETCNIPDWVILEAGDPETEAEKLKNRSPRYNAEDYTGKLLLTHGTNDSRVPIEGSRWMADSLEKYNKNYKLVEFEGQGHGIKGLENQIRFYKTWFNFLESLNGKEEE